MNGANQVLIVRNGQDDLKIENVSEVGFEQDVVAVTVLINGDSSTTNYSLDGGRALLTPMG